MLSFASASGWREWLGSNHASSSGAWLRLAKKGAAEPSLSYDEAVEVALCYGWIDGQARRENEHYWLQSYTPRGRRSVWSKRNREKALALIASDKMQAAGLAEVERAQADGRWDAAYDSPKTITVPPDLEAALEATPSARTFFDTLDGQNRYSILLRVQTAKRPETRARRIENFIAMLAANKKLYP